MKHPTKKQLNERIAELENDLVDAIRVGDNDQLNKLKMKHFNLIAKVLWIKDIEKMLMEGEPIVGNKTFHHFEKQQPSIETRTFKHVQ